MTRSWFLKQIAGTCFLGVVSLTLCKVSEAYEYSIRNAFCQDYAGARSHLSSANFHYDFQVAYNSCMRSADTLINKHEADKEKKRQQQLENQRRWKIESEERKRRKLQEKLEEERRRRDLEKEIDLMFEDAGNLFR